MRQVATVRKSSLCTNTHIEPCRYGKGSNAMGMLQTLMTDGGGRIPRWLKFVFAMIAHPIQFVRVVNVRHWSERTIIALVMQNLDNSITTFTRQPVGRKISSRQGHGQPNPTWIPEGNDATRRIAKKIGGVAGGTWGELFNIPLTAHPSSVGALSPRTPSTASSTRTTASTATRLSAWSTVRQSRPTSESTRR